jgi:2-dehydropantoate 2-reductase
MRIAIVGAGGVGGWLAGKLAAAGADVAVIARGAHLAGIRAKGLTVRTAEGESTHPLRAEADAAAIGPVDVVIVAVKSQDIDGLDLSPLIGPETMIWPLLNGVEAIERLDAKLGAGRSLVGIARISASIAEPGVVAVHSPWAKVELGEADGTLSARVARLRDAMTAAGVETIVPHEPLRALWLKFLMLGPFAGTTAVARCDAATIRAEPLLTALYRRLVEETCAVGRACGARLDDADVEGAMKALAGLPATMQASMAYDLSVGKPLEVDWLSGAVSRLGDAHGVDTPANDAVWAALKPFAAGRPA